MQTARDEEQKEKKSKGKRQSTTIGLEDIETPIADIITAKEGK